MKTDSSFKMARIVVQICCFLLILSNFHCAHATRIVFFYAFATHSHRTAIEPLAHKLVERGHNVTFLSPVRQFKPNPKIQEFVPIDIKTMYESDVSGGFGDQPLRERLASKYANSFTSIRSVFVDVVEPFCRVLLQSPDMKPWVESNTFDLVILNYPDNKCAYALAHYWNASVIASSPSTFFTSEEEIFGFPLETSWLPRFSLENIFREELALYDRVFNTIDGLLFHWYLHWYTVPVLDGLVREFLNWTAIPSIGEMEAYKTSLVFINQHFSEDYARSLPPSVIPIGGMHCTDEHKPLPQDLEEFTQGIDDGFIFLSFGSLVKMSRVPEQLTKTMFDAIKDLNIRFLWRWDSDPPANLPKNVLARKWFPQQDLLAHPSIKGFVSHGGLMSLQQAIFHAVPLLEIPITFDQPFNARKVKHHGIGLHLELSEITPENFREAVLQLAYNESLKARAKVVSSRFRDRPMSPVETAVYWTEYVLKHRDCSHMKPLAVYQPWWQQLLLDVWFAVFTVVVVIVLLVVKAVRIAVTLGSSKEKEKIL